MTICAKVLDIGDTNVLPHGRRVQTILVGDRTDSAELALWESFINACELDESYKFTQLKVKIYNGQYSIYTPKQDTKNKKIEPLQNVVKPKYNIKRTKEIEEAKVIAVSNFITFHKCISCHKGRVLPVNDEKAFGRCTDCSTALQLKNCPSQMSALLTVKSTEECPLKLLCLDDNLSLIADMPLQSVTDIALLSAKKFKAVYNIVTKEIVEILKY